MNVTLRQEWREDQRFDVGSHFVSHWLEPTERMKDDLVNGIVAWRYEVRVSETDDRGFVVNCFEVFKYEDGTTGEGGSPGNVRLPKSESEAVQHVEGLVQSLSQDSKFAESGVVTGV